MTFEDIENDFCEWPIEDWGLKIETANERMWSAELRITPVSTSGKCDVSTVFFSVGHDGPLSAVIAVYQEAKETFWTKKGK